MGVDDGDMMGSMSGAFGRTRRPKTGRYNAVDNGRTASHQEGRRTHTTHRRVDTTVEINQPTFFAKVDDARANRTTKRQTKRVQKAQRTIARADRAEEINQRIDDRKARRGSRDAIPAGVLAQNLSVGARRAWNGLLRAIDNQGPLH